MRTTIALLRFFQLVFNLTVIIFGAGAFWQLSKLPPFIFPSEARVNQWALTATPAQFEKFLNDYQVGLTGAHDVIVVLAKVMLVCCSLNIALLTVETILKIRLERRA